MNYGKRSFATVSVLLAVYIPSIILGTGALNARDTDLVPLTFAAAHTAKQKCINTCRARHRDCRSLNQIPSFECRNVYEDCRRFTCKAVHGNLTSWALTFASLAHRSEGANQGSSRTAPQFVRWHHRTI